MPQYQLTLDSDTLQHLFAGNDPLAQLLEQGLNQILEAQVTEHLQAQPYERTDQRKGHRNGYKPRQLTTRIGTLHLHLPQVRDGSFSTDLFARYQRSEQALVLTLMEMVLQGVSTRKVAAITEQLCGKEFSKSTVSVLCQQLDPLVQAWNTRDLSGLRYPFVLVDALVIKVREAGRVKPLSVLIATAINEHGYREILGLQLGDSESEVSGTSFFVWLQARGLRGIDLVVSDDQRGLVKAIRQQFQGVTWQRCQTHFARNLHASTPKAFQSTVMARIHAIFDAPDPQTARLLLQQFIADFQAAAPATVSKLEDGFDDATAVLALPDHYRKRLRTTNSQERLNEEIRRRARVIRIFPNRESAMRLVGALLMEFDEQWGTGKKYFDMTAYWVWKEAHTPARAPTKQTA
jgi:transposase-like protein